MTLTPEQVLSWEPTRLATAADAMATDRRALIDLQDEVDGARPPRNWSGADADAARASHRTLYAQLVDLVAPLSRVVDAFDIAAREIRRAQDELADTQQAVRGRGWTVEYAGGQFTVTTTPDAGEGAAGEAERFAHQMADALARAAEADQTLAGVLQSANRGGYDTDAATLAAAGDFRGQWQDLSARELAGLVAQHPGLADDPALMNTIEQRIAHLVPATAGVDAEALAEGDLDAAGQVALVRMYGQYAQAHDQTMPRAAAEYLRGLVSSSFPDVGGEYRVDISGAVDAQHALDQAAQGGWTHGLLADSLLLASDGELNPHGQDILGADAVPSEVTQALHDTPAPMAGASPVASLGGGDGYRALAGLLAQSGSGVGAGEEFSRDLTGTTADLVTDMNTWKHEGIDAIGKTLSDDEITEAFSEHTPAMQQMIDVATRNEHANAAFLDDAATGEHGAPQQLASLYTHHWNDNGAAVAGYTDWIGPCRGSADPHQQQMATEAMAHVVDVTTSRSITVGDQTFVEAMMQGAHGDEGQFTSVGQQNPEVIRSLSGATAHFLPDLSSADDDGEGPGGAGTFASDEGDLKTSGADKGRLFTLLGSDPVAANSLGGTIGAYQQANLDAAVVEGSDAAIGQAAKENTRLGGLMGAGRYNADALADHNVYETQQAAYADQLRSAATGRTIITDVGAPVPYAGALSSGLGDIYESIAAHQADPPDATYDADSGDYSDGAAQRRHAGDELYGALSRQEADLPPRGQDLLEQMRNTPGGEDWDRLRNDDKDLAVETFEDQPVFHQFQDDNRTVTMFDQHAMDIKHGDSPEANAHNQAEVEHLLTGDRQPG